jgi:glycosyltransferase involved in cell wall biosynthesis
MRIGFDAKRLFLNNRGLGSYARNLLYGLERYAHENHFHLYTPEVKNEYVSPSLINSENVKIHLPSGLGKISSSYWRSGLLGSEANKEELDVFHGLSQELPNDISKFKGKSVVTIHDLIFIQHPEFYKPIDRWIYRKKVKAAVERADHIIAISKQTPNDVVAEFSFPKERIQVLYQSCNEVFYDKRSDRDREIVRAKWNLPEDYILYVGALNENKNVEIILKALKVLEGAMDLPLVIVGSGLEYRERLEEYIRKNNMQGRVIFATDNANPSPLELSSIYQMSSLFIFPSHYEGFGIPILEARFSGIPVIASNSSCLDEAGGVSTFYFDPTNEAELANEIESALGSTEHLATPPDEFRSERLIENLMEIYRY